MLFDTTPHRAVYEKFKDGTVKDISDDIPFEIPTSWRWVRLGSVCTIVRGSGIKRSETTDHGFPCIRYGEIYTTYGYSFLKTKSFTSKNVAAKCNKANYGDVLCTLTGEYKEEIAKATAYLGEEPIAIGGDLARISNHPYDPMLLAYFMFSPFLLSQKADKSNGDIIVHIGKEAIEKLLIPLPPLGEQKRITEKLERLLPLVEKYGEMEEQRLLLDADLPTALEKSILQEAIQGKLVPQDPNDEPASELLKRVAVERKALIKAGKLKRDKGESVVFRGSDRLAYETRAGETVCVQAEIPFDIPDSWEWVRLGSVIALLSGRDLEPCEYSASPKKFPYMTGASNFVNGKLIVNRWTDKSATISHCGDLLITCKGTIGAMAFNTIGNIHIARQIMAISSRWVSLEYVKVFLESIVLSLKCAANSMIPGIDRNTMLSLLVPLPPLAEQKRIAKKVEEMKAKIRMLVNL